MTSAEYESYYITRFPVMQYRLRMEKLTCYLKRKFYRLINYLSSVYCYGFYKELVVNLSLNNAYLIYNNKIK